MAFVPTPGVAKVALHGILVLEDIINTLWFASPDEWDAAHLQVLADATFSWFTTHVLPFLAASFTALSSTATDQSTDGGVQATHIGAGTDVGGASGASAPANASLVVSFRTDRTGRSYRGRNYIAGIPMAQVNTPTTVLPAYQAGVMAAYAELSGTESAANCTHVVVSKFHNKVARPAGVPTTVMAYSADNRIDSQRRRLAGRGI